MKCITYRYIFLRSACLKDFRYSGSQGQRIMDDSHQEEEEEEQSLKLALSQPWAMFPQVFKVCVRTNSAWLLCGQKGR